MKVVILCGGKGTRMRDETTLRPKPMIPIGPRPILWHIMKTYAAHGHTDFILCLGHLGQQIKDYFRNYRWQTGDVTISRLSGAPVFHDANAEAHWRITLAETGAETGTGARLKQVGKYLDAAEPFLLTYGDGLADVDITASIAAHKSAGKLCTLTAVHPPGRFGQLRFGSNGEFFDFAEKPAREDGWVNGGFMVCQPEVLNFLTPDPGLMFELAPLANIALGNGLNIHQHAGFWQCMDTPQEMQHLNTLWDSGNAPWKIWP